MYYNQLLYYSWLLLAAADVAGECENNPAYMRMYCKLACGLCEIKAPAEPQQDVAPAA
jgi:hypothetical protein